MTQRNPQSLFHNHNHNRETLSGLMLAILIGVGTGFGAVGFRWLISFFRSGFFDGGQQVFQYLGAYYVVLIPALGGLILGPLVYFLAREAQGHGVPEVMAAVTMNGGVIRPRVVIVKTLASALTIGSGGSVGREGPIVQIGSAIGSAIGQFRRVSPQRLKALVACGAAGGIAATFNAPIGGVLFALEVILGEFSGGHLKLVIVSAVTATVIGRVFLGDIPAFTVPAYSLYSPWELVLYVGLGIATGVFAVLYIKTLYKFEDAFEAFKKVPPYIKPVFGGLLVGAIGYFFPQIFGVGYETIESALTGQLTIMLIVILLLMKLIATSITIGSGGSGGVFAPGLFMGSMLGGSLGVLFHYLFPNIAQEPAAYALVGMAGVFAGSAQAPITAIVILFEMSDNYQIILPLMITAIISATVARGIFKQNIYTVKLSRRGLDIEAARLPDILKHVPIREVMVNQVETVPHHFTVKEALRLIGGSRHQGFPVVGADNRLFGIVTRRDLEQALLEGRGDNTIQVIVDADPVRITVAEPLSMAAQKLARFNIGRLPVVDSLENLQLRGIITRSDIIRAYHQASPKAG